MMTSKFYTFLYNGQDTTRIFFEFPIFVQNSNFTGFVDCTLNKVLHGNINNCNKGKTSEISKF